MGWTPGASLTMISGPTAEPLSVDEAKKHCKIDASDEDDTIAGYIRTARAYCEGVQNRAFVAQVWELTLNDWPCHKDYIELPLPPLRAVHFVKYKDTAGTVYTWDPGRYFIDKAQYLGRVVRGYGMTWPTTTLLPSGAISVRFTAGYATPFSVDLIDKSIYAPKHPYVNGDIMRLTNSGGNLPAGLTTLTDYYVVNVSGNTLQLALTEGGTPVDITSAGTGTHFLGEIPANVTQAMKLLIGHYYANREAVLTGTISKEIEFAVESLLSLDRVWPM